MAEAKEAPKPKVEKKKKVAKAYAAGKQCPKCHSRMGDHKDRMNCGKCGYTEFKQKK